MTRHALITRNAALDAIAALCNGGILRFYEGSQPATPETAPTGNQLCELRLSATAFFPAAGGSVVAKPITGDTAAALSGKAGWFRIFKTDGTTAVIDGKISTAGAEINMNNLQIQAGAIVECASLTISLNNS